MIKQERGDAAMTVPRIATMTQEEYDKWCWTVDLRTEFVDGQVIVMSPESVQDDNGRVYLGALLLLFVEERNLGMIFGPNYMTHLREGLRRIPDLLFVSNRHADRIEETHLQGGPDLAVEFVSRGSVRRDRHDKFGEYAKAGVQEYWIVDARKCTIDAYVLGANRRFVPLPIEDGVLRSRVLPGFWFRVEWLFQKPRPTLNFVQRQLGLI